MALHDLRLDPSIDTIDLERHLWVIAKSYEAGGYVGDTPKLSSPDLSTINTAPAQAISINAPVTVNGSAPKVIEALPSSTVYKLAADATPDAVRNAVVQEIAAGKSLSCADVERRIDEAKGLERAGREQEREQRAADRKAIADAKAWEAKEMGLKKSGASDEDIQKERRAWDTAKAKSERKKDAKRKRAEERAQKVEREKQQRRDENQACEDRTRAAADFIRQRLASDLDALRSVLDGDLNAWDLIEALKA